MDILPLLLDDGAVSNAGKAFKLCRCSEVLATSHSELMRKIFIDPPMTTGLWNFSRDLISGGSLGLGRGLGSELA